MNTFPDFWKNLSLENISAQIDDIIYTEQWTAIQGYEGIYEVSTFGRIKSLNRIVLYKNGKHKSIKTCIRKQIIDIDEYLVVGLYKNGNHKIRKVNILVCKAFVSNPNNYPQTNHLFGNKKDNFYTHLEWCTNKQNIAHAIATGLTKQRGAENGNAIISNKTALEIFNSNLSRNELCKIYNVGKHIVATIKTGRAYSSITGKAYIKRYFKNNVELIMNIFNSTKKYEEIAAEYGVTYGIVICIKTGRTYSNITNKKFAINKRELNAEEIKSIFYSEKSAKEISKQFNIGFTAISKIKNKRTHLGITQFL